MTFALDGNIYIYTKQGRHIKGTFITIEETVINNLPIDTDFVTHKLGLSLCSIVYCES